MFLLPDAPPDVSPEVSSVSAVILPLSLSEVCYDAAGTRLIDRLSIEIGSGEPTVVLGPNGAGKTLFLRLCHGLIAPTSGSILWAGRSPSAARRQQAMVFQRPVMLRRSAAANVAYALKLRRVPRRERRARVAQALEWTGLAEVAQRPAQVLSGGEQQRLAFARAWALRPQVLLLDEPTASLDPAAVHAVEQVIAKFAATGVKVILTTQDLAQARRLASEVVFLHAGRVLERACTEDFFARPATPEAAAFVSGKLIC